MALEVWLAFIGAATLIAVSPGAGAIQSMATGLTHGAGRPEPSLLGVVRHGRLGAVAGAPRSHHLMAIRRG